jgi:hypothetical protein
MRHAEFVMRPQTRSAPVEVLVNMTSARLFSRASITATMLAS